MIYKQDYKYLKFAEFNLFNLHRIYTKNISND